MISVNIINSRVDFCFPYCPNQKRNVENNVGIIKKEFEQSYIHSFDTIGEIEEFLKQVINKLNGRKHPRKNDICENLVNHDKTSFPITQNRLCLLSMKEGKSFKARNDSI